MNLLLAIHFIIIMGLYLESKEIEQFFNENPELDPVVFLKLFIDMYNKFKNSKSILKNNVDMVDMIDNIALGNTETRLQNNINHMSENLRRDISGINKEYKSIVQETFYKLNESTGINLQITKDLEMKIDNLLSKLNMSSEKGRYSENIMGAVLEKMYPNAEVCNTSGIPESGDIILRRINSPSILIENKNYTRTVNKQDIPGLMISQSAGIACKNNFQLEIHDKIPVIFCYKVNYDPDIIRTAIEVLESSFKSITEKPGEIYISDELISVLNEEITKLVKKKIRLIELCKDLTKEVKDMVFPGLEEFTAINRLRQERK
jgi:uncharacterized protein YneF (UPF0154 family)